MKLEYSDRLCEELHKLKIREYVIFPVHIDDDEYQSQLKHLEEDGQHPDWRPHHARHHQLAPSWKQEDKEMRAKARCIAHEFSRGKLKPQRLPEVKQDPPIRVDHSEMRLHFWNLSVVQWIQVFLLLAILFVLCSPKAHGQTASQIYTITVTDGTNTSKFAAPFIFHMSGCSWNATTDTQTCTSGTVTNNPGGSGGQVQYNLGTTAFGGISTMTTDGTIVTAKVGADWLFVDPTGPTKKFSFDASNITAGQTRTVNIPDASSTTVQSDTGASNNFLTAISAQGVISKAQPAFTNLSGSAACSQMPALTGDVTTSAGACATTNVNLPDGVTQAGSLLVTDIAAPSSPAAAHLKVFGDSTDLRFHDKNAAGTIGTTVVSNTLAANNYVNAVSAAGVVSGSRPACATLSDSSGGCSMSTTAGGDLSGTLPSPTVAKVNGIAYSATAAAHTVEVITTANTTATAKVIPDCTDSTGNHLNYTQSTDAFSCGTTDSHVGTVTSVSGTANEITSSGGATPALSIASTFDIHGKTSTAPVKAGTIVAAPATCQASIELYVETDATAGQQLFICNATGNGWVLVGDGGGAGGGVTSVATTSPITGGTITTTGTIACATCVTSAASLTSNALVVGGGSQASAVLASLGTTTTVLHGNAAGLPSFAAVTSSDTTGTFPASAIGSTTQIAYNNAGTESGDANLSWTPGSFMLSTPGVNSVVYVDGVKYPKTVAGIQAAQTAACDGTNPGIVVLPVGTITAAGAGSAFGAISNCAIVGQGKFLTTLKVNAANTSPFIFIGSVANFRLQGLGCNGDRANDANSFDCIQITNSNHIEIIDVFATNNIGNCLDITGSASTSKILVLNSEFSKCGSAIPSTSGSGVAVAGNTLISQVKITHNLIHDNNQGVFIGNSATTTNIYEDIDIAHNSVYSNADSGIDVEPASGGAEVRGLRIEDNDTYCNGWPASGAGFSTNCTAGFLQSGVTASTSGPGIELVLLGLVPDLVVMGNRTHDNTFDGVDINGQMTGTVNTSGTAVTWVSGATFNTKWKANQAILINGSAFLIASVTDSTHLVLTATAGTLSGKAFSAPSYTHVSIIGNQSYNNGQGTIGAGFWNAFADGNTYVGNVARNNNVTGFGCNLSSFTSYSGDKAYRNSRSGTLPDGFIEQSCLRTNLMGVYANDDQASPTQTTGVLIDTQSNNTYLDTTDLFGSTAAFTNNGVGTEINDGGRLVLPGNGTAGAALNLPSQTAPTSPVAGDIWQDTNEEKHVVQTSTSGALKLYDSGGTNAITHTTSGTITSYTVNHPLAAATGVLTGVNSSNVITWAHSGDAAHSLSQLAKTAAVTTFTLCAATANTACGQAGQYRISYNFYGSGTACATVTAGSVGLNLTWTDTNAVTHTTISLPLWDQKSAAMTNGLFNFNTALGTEGASGSYIISTNGTIIQAATTYTACTSGTGTYNLKMTVEQLQ